MSVYKPTVKINNLGSIIVNNSLGKIKGQLSGVIGGVIGGDSVLNAYAGAGLNIAERAAKNKLKNVESRINQISNQASRFVNMTPEERIYGIIGRFNGGKSSVVPIDTNPLDGFGGLSMADIQDASTNLTDLNLSRQDFYVIEVLDQNGGDLMSTNVTGHSKFYLLCTGLDFQSFQINFNQDEIGSAVINQPTTSMPTEISLSMLDNIDGIVKRWAEQKLLLATPANGLVNPSGLYAFQIKIIFGTNKSNSKFYNQEYTVGISEMSHQLDRENPSLERVQIRLSQLDTFMMA